MWFCLKIAYLDLLVNHCKELLYYFEVSPIQTQLRSGACSLRWSTPRTPGLCLDATGSGAGPDGPDGSSADAHAQIGEG
jgi:hypothetical protein